MKGFKHFLGRARLIDVAIAFVVGAAFNAVVQALVKDLVTPLITAATGSRINFSNLTTKIDGSTFAYGAFLNALLSFVIIATVIYFVLVAPVARLSAMATHDHAASTRPCPECLSTIPADATRCMYCTAKVPRAARAAPHPR